MIKRLLLLGAAAVVFAAALIVILAILDLVTIAELKESLGRIMAVVAVSTAGLAVIALLIRAAAAR